MKYFCIDYITGILFNFNNRSCFTGGVKGNSESSKIYTFFFSIKFVSIFNFSCARRVIIIINSIYLVAHIIKLRTTELYRLYAGAGCIL